MEDAVKLLVLLFQSCFYAHDPNYLMEDLNVKDEKNNMENLFGYMIGPKAENMTLFRDLILEALDDHMFWRRNFHPEDKPVVSAADQSTDGYQEFKDHLRDLMFQFLSDAKDGIPFFSPRYIGHMNTDLLLPALVGYFSAMLYNQNNVAGESSPVTVKLEGEVIDMLLKMVGMDPRGEGENGHEQGGWGYLCSGGTAANIYSLWVARNLRTLPIAIRLASRPRTPKAVREQIVKALRQQGKSYSVKAINNRFGKVKKVLGEIPFHTAKMDEKCIKDMTAWELANIPIDELYRLRLRVRNDISDQLSIDNTEANVWIDELIKPFTIQTLGDHNFRSIAKALFPKESNIFAEPWHVYASDNRHYSWMKGANIIGLGQDCIVKVPHLSSFDVDVGKLKDTLESQVEKRHLALMVVSNFGTTEEGALDDLPAVREVLNDLQQNQGATLWWHVDAAYGGYLGAMMRCKLDHDEVVDVGHFKKWLADCCQAVGTCSNVANDLIQMSESGNGWLSWEELIQRTTEMSQADSITLDPHKLGYIPYSAGALLLRRAIAREVVSSDAPYLWLQDGDPDTFVGRFTLEGSRPGAVAAACWLAHKAIPLDQSGHGRLLALSILAARQLYQKLEERFSHTDASIKVDLLHKPHTNMMCYVPYHKNMQTLEEMKQLTERVLSQLSPIARDRQFMVVSTDVSLSKERRFEEAEQLNEILEKHKDDWVKIKVMRSVVMGVYSLNAQTFPTRGSKISIWDAYATHLSQTLEDARVELFKEKILKKVSVHSMVMDDDREVTNQLRELLENLWDERIALSWKHYETETEALKRIAMFDKSLDIVFLDIDMRGDTDNPKGKSDSGYIAYGKILERNQKVDPPFRVTYVVFFAKDLQGHDARIDQLHQLYPNGKPEKVLKIDKLNQLPRDIQEVGEALATIIERRSR